MLCWGAASLPEGAQGAFGNVLLLTSPLWLLWAFIPALGGGGGEVDPSSRLAPYPVSRPAFLAFSWVSSLLDLPYLVPMPIFVAVSYGAAGWLGALLALLFVLGASAFGQLGAWAVLAFSSTRRGESLRPMFISLLLAVLLASLPGALNTIFTYLPPGWFAQALSSLQDGHFDIWPLLGLFLVPLVPALLLPPLLTRALKVRAAGHAFKDVHSWLHPRQPWAFVLLTIIRSLLRSLSVKALFISVMVIPPLSTLVFGASLVSASSLVFFAVFASASTVAVNLWAFEDSGTLLWLSSPFSLARLIWLRLLASVVTLMFFATATLGLFVLFGGDLRTSISAVLIAFPVSVLVSSVGLLVSSLRPSSVDLDSLRARPASLPSVLLFIFLSGALSIFGLFLFVLGGPLLATLAASGAAALSVLLSYRLLVDGSRLLSAFKE